MSSAWEHYRLALQLHDEERGGGWPETTVSILQRARACAISLGKRLDHLDLSLKLLRYMGHPHQPACSPPAPTPADLMIESPPSACFGSPPTPTPADL